MKQFEPIAFLQDLAGLEPWPYLIIGAAVLSSLLLFYFLRRSAAGLVPEEAIAKDAAEVPPEAFQGLAIPEEFVARERSPAGTTESVPEPPTTREAAIIYRNAPQDSVLRRHYVTHVRYMIETVTFPRPSDSVLRRHYEQLIDSELDGCLNDETHLQRLICQYEEQRRATAAAVKAGSAPASPAVHAPAPPLGAPAKTSAEDISRQDLQDSAPKRQHATDIRCMIESVTFPRPSDSVLLRHYDQLIASRLDTCLNDETRMEALLREYDALSSGN